MLFSSSAMRFRSARPHQIRSTLILASSFTSLDCPRLTFPCYARTRPVFTSPLRILTIQNESIRSFASTSLSFANTSPMLCESMPMQSLLSSAMPMRIYAFLCPCASSPYDSMPAHSLTSPTLGFTHPGVAFPLRDFVRLVIALPLRHVVWLHNPPATLCSASQFHYCSLMTS